MPTGTQRSDVAVLLRTEHAVARVLASTSDEDNAHPRLLAAIGAALGWDFGALWVAADAEGAFLRCAHTWEGAFTPVGAFAEASRSVMLAPGQGMPGEVWRTGRPAWIADAESPSAPAAARRRAAHGGPALRLRLPGPLRREGARRHGVLRRRARRARRRAAGHDEQPGVADRAVRRALPRRAERPRERGAQERDPQRRLRLHHHDGRQRAHRRGQRGHRGDLRLHGARSWSAASWPRS